MNLSAHAYVVQGDADCVPGLVNFLEQTGIKVIGNPDVYVQSFAAFLMEDARSLRDRASLRGVGATGRIFVIAAPTIAPDAQNALLKTFEEPSAGAKFILVVPSPDMLLPTLRSRMQLLHVKKSDASIKVRPIVDARAFLSAKPEARVEMLKPLLEKDDDDNRNLSGILAFLSSLEEILSQNSTRDRTGIEAVYRARKYITDRGALLKPLLEQCALLVPTVV